MAAVEDTHWWFIARRRFIEIFLGAPLRKKSRLADIGAGTGGTSAWLGRYGHLTAVEPSPVGRAFLKKRDIPTQKGTATATGLPSNRFDLVTILDVLYHRGVSDDVEALKEVRRLLKPGGKLLVTDCAFEWLAGKHHSAVHGARRYTLPQIVGKIKKAGFVIDRASYTFALVLPFVFLQRMAESIKADSSASQVHAASPFSMFFTILCAIEARMIRYINLPVGSSVIVRAHKPK